MVETVSELPLISYAKKSVYDAGASRSPCSLLDPLSPPPFQIASSPASLLDLPPEILARIYSYCNQPSLVALSLVSFASWQTAGPLLYERVEITTLDQLKSLFYLDTRGISASIRNAGSSFLSSIRSLTLNIQSDDQSDGATPRLDITQPDTRREKSLAALDDPCDRDRFSPSSPYRLLLSQSTSWALPHLTILATGYPVNSNDSDRDSDSEDDPPSQSISDQLLTFYATHLFPHLNPIHFTLRWPDGSQWRSLSLSDDQMDFLERWTALERIELDGWCLGSNLPTILTPTKGVGPSRARARAWGRLCPFPASCTDAAPTGPEEGSGGREARMRRSLRRKLEIVCDFSTRRETRYTHWSWALAEDFTLSDVTRLMGVTTREFRKTVEVKLVVKVRADGGMNGL